MNSGASSMIRVLLSAPLCLHIRLSSRFTCWPEIWIVPNKNIVWQLYYVQDQLKGIVKKGDLWRDVIRIPQAKLHHVETIGLGVTRPPSETFHIDHGLTDWDGHRLCLSVK
jgi:hypothetical protein